jgi:hypothetical protein
VKQNLQDVRGNAGSGKNIGLFSSLANGAKINDLVLNVSTPDGGVKLPAAQGIGAARSIPAPMRQVTVLYHHTL